MKQLPWIVAVLIVAPLWLTGPPTAAQDSVVVAPKLHKVLLENEKVRVLEVTLKPGDKIPMHSHPGGYVAYSVTGSKARFTGTDGKTTERELMAGNAIWSDPVTHTAENIGTTEAKIVVVEFKPAKK